MTAIGCLVQESGIFECPVMLSGAQFVPLIIGGSSSVAAKILCKLLGPLFIPLVSLIQMFNDTQTQIMPRLNIQPPSLTLLFLFVYISLYTYIKCDIFNLHMFVLYLFVLKNSTSRCFAFLYFYLFFLQLYKAAKISQYSE